MRLILFLSFLVLVVNAKATLSYEEIFQKSLKQNIELKILDNKKEIIKEDIDFEKLGYLPKIDFVLGINKTNKDAERDDLAYQQYKNSFSINTNLNLYDFDTRKTKINILKKDKNITRLKQCDTKIKSAVKLLELYSEIKKSRKSIQFLSKILTLHKEKIAMKKKLFTQGFINANEILTEKTKIINIENRINKQINRLNNFIFILNQETGVLLLEETILEPLRTTSFFNKPDINKDNIKTKIVNEKISKLKKEILFFENNNKPKLDLFYNNDFYSENSKNSDVKDELNKRDYRVGVTLKWTLNSLFDYKHQKKKKYLEIKKTKLAYELERKKHKKDFNNRILDIENFEKQKVIKLASINNIEKELNTNERLYTQGLTYKYKITESKIKLLNEELNFAITKLDNNKNKKYLSILLERENICTHH